ncbi:hypothetical protein AK812_SmicGene3585 [Symbiodinium microadriaticum]|uniref:Uncharacterized protein n=1 Tax=Symbiodinium microadriaticum TaxID=2951 RepID=A0A1Q9EYE3_SYMMI|nr:hypothetical protein AK812_SmicGene3585 [Symbiodinium microadriaticum]
MSPPTGQRLRRPLSFEANSLRSTTTRQLLIGLGMIFNQDLHTLLSAGGYAGIRFPTREQMQKAGDTLFHASVETTNVDLFISHSWSAGRWEKFLALCFYLNLQMATGCCMITWIFFMVLLITLHGASGLGGSRLLLPCFVYLPMATFFVVFFFGQQLSVGRCSPSIWIDRLCIHQTDLDLKSEQIKSVPTFVVRSSRMLILCDGSYFERLWCNLELATFARHGGVEKVDVLPLWLAPWLLCCISLELLSASLMDLSQLVFPNWMLTMNKHIMGLAATLLGGSPVLLQLFGWLVIWMTSSMSTLPASIPSFFSFRMKIRHHQLILDQMADFEVRAAKCSEPSDRDAIEQQLQEVFGEQDLAGASFGLGSAVDEGEVKVQRFESYQATGDPLDRFNAYVRGVLRDIVMMQIGDEIYVPWPLCLTTCLPMILYSSVNILGCDNGSCEESARVAGASSMLQYMLANVLGWTLNILLTFPLTYPVMLRMLKCVLSFGDGPLQRSAAFLCCFLAYEYTYICGGLIWGSWIPAVMDPSPIQLTVLLLVITVLVIQCICLFCRPRSEVKFLTSFLHIHVELLCTPLGDEGTPSEEQQADAEAAISAAEQSVRDVEEALTFARGRQGGVASNPEAEEALLQLEVRIQNCRGLDFAASLMFDATRLWWPSPRRLRSRSAAEREHARQPIKAWALLSSAGWSESALHHDYFTSGTRC